MTKKITLLFALMLSTLMASAQTLIDGVYYNLIAKAKQAVVTSGDTKYTGSVTIPESFTYNGVTYSVTSIGSYAFFYCSGLTSVTIPNSVTSIGDQAFYECSGLTSITIPNSVTSIGIHAFSGCSGLNKVIVSDIAAWCKIIFTSELSNPLVYAHHLFMDGKEITDLVIPNSVTSIGNGAFYGCSGLTSISVESGNENYDSRNNCNAIIETASNTLIAGCKNTTIPNSVTSIGVAAFYECSGLTSITIPNSVTSIGGGAFQSCSGLTQVTLNSNAIASKSYSSSSTLGNIFGSQVKEYVLGDDVTSIGSYAFYNCADLTNITIGCSVESIEDYAFASIPKLEKIYCYSSNVTTATRTSFENSYLDYVTLYVPASSLDTYKSTAPWKNAASILPLEDIKEKCATPTILYENGKLSFSCETEGVRFECNFSTPSESYEEGVAVNMPNKLQVSVYAKKDGFDNSDVATMEIEVSGGYTAKKGDVNEDGTVNGTDIQEVINIIVEGE